MGFGTAGAIRQGTMGKIMEDIRATEEIIEELNTLFLNCIFSIRLWSL